MTTYAAPSVPASVQNNSIYLYVLLILVVAGLLVSFVAKNVPTVGKTIDGWVARRRRAAKLARNADIASLREQVQNLTTDLADMRQRERDDRAEDDAHREALTTHAAWDWRAIEAWQAAKAGQASDLMLPAPPLYPQRPKP